VGARGRSGPWNVEPWESDLIKATARRIRTTERDELEGTLALHTLSLKRRRLRGIRHWEAFLRKALLNKARNWVRDQQAREKRMVALDQPPEPDSERNTMADLLGADLPNEDLRIAFAHAWGELDPELRAVWTLLLEESGNQVRVARRLGRHRNTIRAWIRRIQQVLRSHGFYFAE
jgi:DNA-directed RNA polymerase specialized sigma24 family protein